MHKTIRQLIEDLEGAYFVSERHSVTSMGASDTRVDLETHPAWQALKTHLIVTADPNHVAQRGAETQHSIMQWANDTFGTSITPGRAALRSLEEMVELCVEVGLSDVEVGALVAEALGAARAKRKGIQHAAEELADVYITLCRLAWALSNVPRGRLVPRDMYDTNTVDIQAEVDRKMQINRARKWALDGQGSGQHILDSFTYSLPPQDSGHFNCRGDYVYKPAQDPTPRPEHYRSMGGTRPTCTTCLGAGEVDERIGGEAHSGVVPCPDCGGH